MIYTIGVLELRIGGSTLGILQRGLGSCASALVADWVAASGEDTGEA